MKMRIWGVIVSICPHGGPIRNPGHDSYGIDPTPHRIISRSVQLPIRPPTKQLPRGSAGSRAQTIPHLISIRKIRKRAYVLSWKEEWVALVTGNSHTHTLIIIITFCSLVQRPRGCKIGTSTQITGHSTYTRTQSFRTKLADLVHFIF